MSANRPSPMTPTTTPHMDVYPGSGITPGSGVVSPYWSNDVPIADDSPFESIILTTEDKVLALKQAINTIPNVTTKLESYDQFKRIYESLSPSEWLSVDRFADIANHIARVRPGRVDLGVRLGVQVNLFLHSLNDYSHPDTAEAMVNTVGRDPACFALTEDMAGVLSGLRVDTKFKILPGKTPEETVYILNTNDVSKQWISQGLVSKQARNCYLDC